MTDVTDTLAPNSDQIDAIDLHHSGPRTFTVERTVVSKADQPISIHVRELDRVYRPSKNMRRVLADCWGLDSAQWVAHRFTLYNDPEVTFGRDKTGGVRISHVSHIDGPRKVPIILTRGKSGLWTVDPIPQAAPAQAAPPLNIATATDEAALRRVWQQATPDVKAQIEARVAELKDGA